MTKTVWLFRERLKELKLVDVLFARFHEHLAAQGYAARAGQMIDATTQRKASADANNHLRGSAAPAQRA